MIIRMKYCSLFFVANPVFDHIQGWSNISYKEAIDLILAEKGKDKDTLKKRFEGLGYPPPRNTDEQFYKSCEAYLKSFTDRDNCSNSVVYKTPPLEETYQDEVIGYVNLFALFR